MFSLFVEIQTTLSLLACIALVVSEDTAGSSKSGAGCNTVLTASSGNIASPNYGPGQEYTANLACSWTIEAPVGKQINLVFQDFVVEKSSSCAADYLLLYDGKNDTARLVGRYCSQKPAPFTSSSNYIHIRFYSDVSLQYRGFFAKYDTLLSTTAKPTTWKSHPKFKSTILDKTAIVGDMVKLLCEVDGTPEPSITWTKDLQDVIQNKNVIISNTSFKSELIIKKVDKIDQGRYSCKATNGFGSPIEASGSLIVEDRKLPKITNTTQSQAVSVGKRIELNCEAEGLAPMNMSFREKNKKLKKITCHQSVGCQIHHTTKMIVEDTIISCKVWNEAGETKKCIHIKAIGPPFITHAPQNKTIRSGDTVNFTCKAVGKGLKISWLKDNKTTSDGIDMKEGAGVYSVLRLTSVKQNTNLTCKVEGQDGITSRNARVLVKEIVIKNKTLPTGTKLEFSRFPKSTTAKYNETLNMFCNATGEPQTRLSWNVSDPKVNWRNSSFNGGSKLTIQSVKENLTVICFASNGTHTIQKSATIRVMVDKKPVLVAQTSDGMNLKLILGAGGGVLILTGFIILFIVLRRKRNKKIEKGKQRTTTGTQAREEENLITNPLYSNDDKEAVETKPGVEMLHYPRDNIEHTETLEDGSHIEMFLGQAKDLPFSPGNFTVVVRTLKNTDPSEEVKDDFDVEASLLANLVHPNVVRLMAVCIKTPPLCLIFEYSSYGYLDEYLRDCDQSELKHAANSNSATVRDSITELAIVDRLLIAKQIASGMKYLKDKGYVHQDLRARNCLVFKDLQVKVANFGLHWAKPDQNFFVMSPEEKQDFPVRWLPPEVVLYGEFTHPSDVWSYGVLVWEIFSNGHLPYTGINDNDVVSYVRGGNILPRPKLCPHEVYEVMKTCWEITPLERPDFESLQGTMTDLHAGEPV